jgi:hypothetical protein
MCWLWIDVVVLIIFMMSVPGFARKNPWPYFAPNDLVSSNEPSDAGPLIDEFAYVSPSGLTG